MKRYYLLLAFVLVFLIPNLLFSLCEKEPDARIDAETEPSAATEECGRILVKSADGVEEMELDTYVTGVLLGEMPADFEPDALKAQAVATRTYTLRKVIRQSKHSDAHVCTDSACCQAFVREDDYIRNQGTEVHLEKIKSAVRETTGQVLTYNGELIDATYFSSSGGRTEDAAEVWGASVPYLKSVSSPGEETPNARRQFSFSDEEFCARLGLSKSVTLTDDSIQLVYTEGGGVKQMQVGGMTFSGTQIRALLELPSTVFQLSAENDTILITTSGSGHRVGMSQYGAEAMAVGGKTYDEILSHYYPGTKLETFTAAQIEAVFDKAGNL